MAAHAIPVLLCTRDTPTPTLAYHVVHQQLAGAINLSASHHPPEYNGIKFTPAWGGPALPATTQAIEQRIRPLLHGESIKWLPFDRAQADGMIKVYDPIPDYLQNWNVMLTKTTFVKAPFALWLILSMEQAVATWMSFSGNREPNWPCCIIGVIPILEDSDRSRLRTRSRNYRRPSGGKERILA